MPVYRLMREAFRNDQGDYVPGVVWLYDGVTITVSAVPGFDAQRLTLQTQVTDAIQSGFHTDEIWAYMAQQGGQHMASMRSTPEPLIAPDIPSALDAALTSLTTTTR